MDNIHKYFYMICFSAYVRECSVIAKDAKYATLAQDLKLPKTFVAYMDEHSGLRTTVEEARANFSGRDPFLKMSLPGFRLWLTPTSKPILARSSTTSTRALTGSSEIFLRVTTKRGPSIGSPPRSS